MIERNLFYYRIFIVIFWIEACFGFVSEELLPFGFWEPLKSPLYFLLDAILVFLGLATIRKKVDCLILISFLAISFVSTIVINHLGLFWLFNGARDFIPMLFFIPIIRYLLTDENGREFKEKFDKHLYIFLCIQPFCLVEQFIRYGAGDHGGGSMGNGSSGSITTLICIISFYLLSKNWDYDNILKSLKENKKYIFLLFPIFLNETKISFIYLAIYIALLYRYKIKNIGKMIVVAPLMLALFFGLYNVYIYATGQEDRNVLSVEFINDYLIGEDIDEIITYSQLAAEGEFETDNVWFIDLPRFLKIFLIPDALADANGGMTWGAGLGQFKGGTSMDKTKFASEHKWVLNGSIFMTFYFMIQLGFIGLIWGILAFCAIIWKNESHEPHAKRIKLFMIAIFLVSLVYHPFMTFLPVAVVFYYLVAVSTMQIGDNEQVNGRLCECR